MVVYLGVIFEAKNTSSKNKIISDSVLAIGFRKLALSTLICVRLIFSGSLVVTVVAAWYIYSKMNKARIVVWRKQR